jgi:hypothetical protein
MSSAPPDLPGIDSQSEGLVSGNDEMVRRLDAEEEFFLKLYTDLTHETEAHARCVFMFVCEALDNGSAHAEERTRGKK